MSTPQLLIIDDHEQVGEVLVEIGRMLGYSAHFVVNHAEFIEHVRDWDPSVIITDLQMPDVDGIAIIRLLAEQNTAAKIVIISGMDEKLIQVAARVGRERGLNVVATFTKPFDLADVSALLGKLKPAATFTAADLRDAVLTQHIETYFQSKYELSTGRLVGAEALARWNHPIFGDVAPSVFIPMVEQLGLAGFLLEHVLRKTCQQMVRWRDLGVRIPVAVNISSRNVSDVALPETLEEICVGAGVSCDQIILELTESDSMDTSTETLEVLTRLRLKGFQLSIDDFGTGFSSLQRLMELPFTELKIDRSFIASVTTDTNSAVIVKSIVSLAENLGLRSVAEGIEDRETAKLLTEWKCVQGQGFGMGRPVPADQFFERLVA